jgi:protein-tyrosine phosphatase
MAQALYQHKMRQLGRSDLSDADSAGIGCWHPGTPPHPKTLRLLEDCNIPCSHQSRQITRADLDEFDLILTMDREAYRSICALGRGRARIEPFIKYAESSGYDEVPDPLGTGDFDGVFKLISTAVENLAATLAGAQSQSPRET